MFYIMTKSKKVTPIPPGFRTVTPYLTVNGGLKALDFYEKAFGAKEDKKQRQVTSDGKVIHARFKIGDSLIMLSDYIGMPAPAPSQSPVTLHIYSKDVDKAWERAVAAGAKPVMPLEDTFWGERYGLLVDPYGHRWTMSMRVSMTKEEMAAKQKEAMERFSGGMSG